MTIHVMAHQIELAETARNRWATLAPAGHTLADALHPIYFWHRHEQIRPGDILEIRHAKHAFYVELYVLSVDKETHSILTRPVCGPHDWSNLQAVKPDLSGVETAYKGKVSKWCVLKGTDKLVEGLDSKEDAEAWIAERAAA